MKQITEISDDIKQKFNITLENGGTFELKLEYIEQQAGWFYSITYGDLIINGSRLVTSVNILRAYKNRLPFGISIIADDGSEPIFLDDFSSERVKFYLLTESEVADFETEYYNG